ncbi:MAG: addiction module protein [Reyranellaceae bacterium]|jgi:putative addiction module component (TIGR02574 family)
MTAQEFDPRSLSIDERLELIDKLRMSIALDARHGDRRAKEVVDHDRPLGAAVLAELHRRAQALESNPSSGIPWDQLNEELKKKYG